MAIREAGPAISVEHAWLSSTVHYLLSGIGFLICLSGVAITAMSLLGGQQHSYGRVWIAAISTIVFSHCTYRHVKSRGKL
jgi:hypothetical protein